MGWELYKDQCDNTRPMDAPGATILKSGKLSINASASNLIMNWKYVKLYYDIESNSIGLKYSENPIDHRVSFRLGCKGAHVFIRGFLKYYGIDYSSTKKCIASYDDNKKFMIVHIIGKREVKE